jgi:hypothetical protein
MQLAQRSPKISKIVNVYQDQYANGEHCTGIGDFIRGSLCLLQYGAMQNIEVEFNYDNHPISHFLTQIQTQSQPTPIHPFRVLCYKNNHQNNNTWQKIQQEFTKVIAQNPNCIQPNTSAFAMYTIAFPMQPVQPQHKKRIQKIFQPTPILNTKIRETMAKMEIISKQYTIIHVRTGDEYLIHHAFTSPQLVINCKKHFIKMRLHQHLIKNKAETESTKKEEPKEAPNEKIKDKYVLISDSVEFKKQLKRAYPKLITAHYSVTHLGEGVSNKKDLQPTQMQAIENTLVDFFLIANAKKVHAFSTLEHGTGFSRQCCEIYNIPYHYTFLAPSI